MIRALPAKRALVVRDNRQPVICKVRYIWKDRLYRSLRHLPLPSLAAVPAARLEPLPEPVPASRSTQRTTGPWSQCGRAHQQQTATGRYLKARTSMADSTAALAVIVKDLGRRVEAIAADLGELAKTVQASLAGEGKADSPAAPVWTGLTQDEYDAQLADLAAFVDQHLRVTYAGYLRRSEPGEFCLAAGLNTVAPCGSWARCTPNGTGSRQRPPNLAGALAWHDRWLPGVRARLLVILVDCTEHRAGTISPAATDGTRGEPPQRARGPGPPDG